MTTPPTFNGSDGPAADSWIDRVAPDELLDIVGPSDEAVRSRRAKSAKRTANSSTAEFTEDEPWPTAVRGATVLQELRSAIETYMVLPPFAADAIAVWIAHTYVFDCADFTPYLLVTSPVRECGKSTLLDLLSHVVYRPQLTGGISAAALYRRIDRLHPTMLIDEIDVWLAREGAEALRGVLNTGFHRNGKYTICVGDSHHDKSYSTFSPKVLAGIGRVWDTVASRSIPIRLSRAARTELSQLKKIRGDRIRDECESLRRKLLRWAEELREALPVADTVIPDALGARESDVWRPLMTIADIAGEDWPERVRRAACALHGDRDDEGDDGLRLLADIRIMFRNTGEVRLTSSYMADQLAAMEERPWPEFRNGRPITPTQIASILRRFGITPKNIRIGDRVPKGYELTAFNSAFERYLPTAEIGATTATRDDVAPVAEKVGIAGGDVVALPGSPKESRIVDELERRRHRDARADRAASH